MKVPEELRYTKDHEWLHAHEGVVTVGITDHAQDQLGDVVFVELPEVGAKLTGGDPFGTVESVKAVSDLFCPVSGHVTEVNELLANNPELINKDPYSEGWLIRLRPESVSDIDTLMDASAYKSFAEANG